VKNVDYLRISVTDRCNLACLYCRPGNPAPRTSLLTFEEIGRVVEAGVRVGIDRFRITGGEPTVRRGVSRLVELLAGRRGVSELSLTTNGVVLSRLAVELRAAGLHRVNVSLDTLDRERYRRITGLDAHDRVIAGIRAAKEQGLEPVKVNVVAIRGFNDDEIVDFALFGASEGVQIRFIEMMPFRCNRTIQRDLFLSTDDILAELGRAFPVTEEGRNGPGPARYYRLGGTTAVIGLISPFSRPFCSTCNRLRLTPFGGLRSCLFSDRELDLRRALRSGAATEELADLIRTSISRKQNGHHLVQGEPGCRTFSLSEIGG
jgi:cyclic pyranopterin phosphate synthase